MKTAFHMPQWMWPAGYANIKVKRYSFGLLLGLSLLVHLLLLAGWPSSQAKQIELTLPVADFAVHLTPAAYTVESAQPQTAHSAAIIPTAEAPANSETRPVQISPAKTHEHKQHAQRQALVATQTKTKKTEAPIKTVTLQTSGASQQPATEKPAPSTNHNQVISRLQHKFKQYFYYPRLARRKNIQGTVVIGFAINLRGTLTNIRVIKSSGFAILDMAAEDALLKLHHLDTNQNWQANNRDLELPVIYKLTEG